MLRRGATVAASPRWVKESEGKVSEYVKKFQDSLRRIAIRFAHHARADSIDAIHVDEAFEALVLMGLKRQPWWKRSELTITISGVFIGIAVACPDFVPLIFKSPTVQEPIAIGTILVCGVLGGIFYLWGWFQGKL